MVPSTKFIMSDTNFDEMLERRIARFSKLTTTVVDETFAKKGYNKPCSVCSSNNWMTVVNENTEMSVLQIPVDKGKVEDGGSHQAYLARICSTCGHTQFFNLGWFLVYVWDEDEA